VVPGLPHKKRCTAGSTLATPGFMASGAADGDGEGPIDAEGDAAGFADGEATAAGAAVGGLDGADVAGGGGALEHAVVTRARKSASGSRMGYAKREAARPPSAAKYRRWTLFIVAGGARRADRIERCTRAAGIVMDQNSRAPRPTRVGERPEGHHANPRRPVLRAY
jgi:hypothetical protein